MKKQARAFRILGFLGVTLFCCSLQGEDSIRTVAIFGLVESPGKYQLQENEQFLSLTLKAGGLSRNCSGRAKVRRESGDGARLYQVNLWVLLNEEQDFVLQANDTVFFPHDDWAPRHVDDPATVKEQIQKLVDHLEKSITEQCEVANSDSAPVVPPSAPSE